jgi:hypothetical protein
MTIVRRATITVLHALTIVRRARIEHLMKIVRHGQIIAHHAQNVPKVKPVQLPMHVQAVIAVAADVAVLQVHQLTVIFAILLFKIKRHIKTASILTTNSI